MTRIPPLTTRWVIVSLISCLLATLACSAAIDQPSLSSAIPNKPTRKFADAHIHFNWDQKEITSAKEIVEILQQHQVTLAIVAGTPTSLALELGAELTPSTRQTLRIIPLFSPYTHELGKQDWYKNTSLAQQFEAGLKAKQYFGLGEVHFISGYPPRLDNQIFLNLLSIADRYKVPSLIHIDSADASLFLRLCKQHPRQKLIFAHGGGNLNAAALKPVLQTCRLAWIDLAARDPWRYGGLTDASGKLLQPWLELIVEFPQKFITGTDPVWRVTRTQSWDQSDDGWQHYDKLYRYHQDWLNQLPAHVAQQIAWDNVIDAYNLQKLDD